MNKYYTLKLNNSFDYFYHYISINKMTFALNIISNEISDLSLLEEKFMSLDNSIEETTNKYKIFGCFPIIGIENNDKIYDLITGKLIKYNNNPKEINGLSYNSKSEANINMLNLLLTLLDDVGIKKYKNCLLSLEEYSKALFYGAISQDDYYLVNINNISPNKSFVIAKKIKNDYIELFTKEKIYPKNKNMIIKNISSRSIVPISKKEALYYISKILDSGYNLYIDAINSAKKNSISNYYNYVNNSMYKEKKLIKK